MKITDEMIEVAEVAHGNTTDYFGIKRMLEAVAPLIIAEYEKQKAEENK